LRSFIFSPRAVAFNHGTGAQIIYLLDAYKNLKAINYGFYEKSVTDRAVYLESRWHRVWPWALRGRGFLARINDYLPFAIWRRHRLTNHGKKLLRKEIASLGGLAHVIAIVHDNTCALRINSVIDFLRLPYTIVLYDLMHLETPSPNTFPALAECLHNADCVYAISQPLRDAAIALGASKVEPISFYRPKGSNIGRMSARVKKIGVVRILVVADAKPVAFDELLSAVATLQSESTNLQIQIEFVGNPGTLPMLSESRKVAVTFHGFVPSEQRDNIASGCDVAFLAGSTSPSRDCPLVKYSIPSKIGDFAVFGLPVLARVSDDSAAARFIRDELSGFVKVATSLEEVLKILRELCSDGELVVEMAEAAFAFAEEKLFLPNATTNALARNRVEAMQTQL
jgi:hypothetical protein